MKNLFIATDRKTAIFVSRSNGDIFDAMDELALFGLEYISSNKTGKMYGFKLRTLIDDSVNESIETMLMQLVESMGYHKAALEIKKGFELATTKEQEARAQFAMKWLRNDYLANRGIELWEVDRLADVYSHFDVNVCY